jgi:predicted acyltransferase
MVPPGEQPAPAVARAVSIDALRGLVMGMMIFVNDLAGAPKSVVPDWMVHFSDRHQHMSGMTFVDLVFPAFLFLVGMSLPLALGGRLSQGQRWWRVSGHVLARAAALLAIGILMVNNESPAPTAPGWSPERWGYLMFLSAILAFCVVSPRGALSGGTKWWRGLTVALRVLGIAGMVYCAFTFRGEHGTRVITLWPPAINTEWYGILGIIGWSYLFGAGLFLGFRNHRPALLGSLVLLLCLYPADQHGLFDGFSLAKIFGIGEIGAHTAIVTAGLLLASLLVTPETGDVRSRTRFALLAAAGYAAAAWLVGPLYGISKNEATPSWCLWACAITTLLWLLFYYLTDVRPVSLVSRPLKLAGQNVLLAYLLSELLPSPLGFIPTGQAALWWYVARSAIWAVLLLAATVGINRLGFRLKI